MDHEAALVSTSADIRESRRTPLSTTSPAALCVIVPLSHRSPSLADFADAMLAIAHELQALDATILFMNDMPADADLREALDAVRERLDPLIAVEVHENLFALGFAATANRALDIARTSVCDAILIDPDVYPAPGAFTEMRAVAYRDPLISLVSPRCEPGPTDCTAVADGTPRSAPDHRAQHMVECNLPRHMYVPATDGICLLIKRSMIAEFGLLDPRYDRGWGASNDFLHRCNQRGYRAVVANRAYVRIGTTIKTDDDSPDHAILMDRYPEHDRAVARYLDSAEHRAEHVLRGLVPIDGKLSVLFDASCLAAYFNGTFEHICCVLKAFAGRFSDRYDIRILCEEEAFHFHGLHQIGGLRHVIEAQALSTPSAVAFRLNQPDMLSMGKLGRFGAVAGSLMLDTIAMDCQQLDDTDLHRIWSHAATYLDLIGFNSQFTRDQFERRFTVPDAAVQFVSLCSVDPRDYAPVSTGPSGGGGILLIGNAYPHKHVAETIAALNIAGSTLPIISFGVALDDPSVVASYAAGSIPRDVVDRLYANADFALYPSHYEGFGLPIMHALARRLPVIARDLPCAREIKAGCPDGHNLHLCGSTDDMAALAATVPRWHADRSDIDAPIWDWDAAAGALADAFEQGLRQFDFDRCLAHQAAALNWDAACQARAQRSRIAHLETGLGLARRTARRFETEVRDCHARLTESTAREERAHLARRAVEAAERDALTQYTLASQRAEEAEDRRRVAEASAKHAHIHSIQADKRADVAEAQGAALARLVTSLTAAQSEARMPPPGRTLRFLDWVVSRSWPRAAIEHEPPLDSPPLPSLRLSIGPDACADSASRATLLRWLRCVALGGDVWIEWSGAADRDNSTTTDNASIDALLALGGLTIRWREGRCGRSTVRTAKTLAWPNDITDDAQFVDLAYRYWLGRAPDPVDRQHINEQLRHGIPRDAVTLEIAASQPCWERWRGVAASA
jgi:glycosyltransferase involved in cell wall biosynthesis